MENDLSIPAATASESESRGLAEAGAGIKKITTKHSIIEASNSIFLVLIQTTFIILRMITIDINKKANKGHNTGLNTVFWDTPISS